MKQYKSQNTVIFLLIILWLIIPAICNAQWMSDTFIDPSDGQLDMSNWLLEKKGFLPIPIVVTEPAIGYGGGLAMAYFHDKASETKAPPSVSIFGAGGTENGTWFAGAGHMGIWQNDNIRYNGGVGGGLIKTQYYGLSTLNPLDDPEGVDFQTDFIAIGQQIQLRLGDSRFFAGIGFVYADTENHFDISSDRLTDLVPELTFDTKSVATTISLVYDSRDNIFSPSSGIASSLEGMFFDEAWGSDNNFQKFTAKITYYNPLTDRLVLGMRGAASTIVGDAPFYSYPFIDIRGVKAMQFQGNETLVGELELRWKLTERWYLLAFGGAGQAYSEGLSGDSDVIFGHGAGLRYLGASKLGLTMGLDIAKGPDETIFYIQVGSSWALR